MDIVLYYLGILWYNPGNPPAYPGARRKELIALETRKAFMDCVNDHLATIDPAKLLFNRNEFWLIQSGYEQLECYAVDHRLHNMAIALPLARSLHDGAYRKFGVHKGGSILRVPYYIHCLMVCRMLVNIRPALSHDDEDVVLSAALCHDLIEDIPFPEGGTELYTQYGLDKRIYEVVKLLSKRSDFSLEDERRYFESIRENPLALLVKLADRGNNVEDLYNMSPKKFAEYLEETEHYFFPISDYGIARYPELAMAIHILKDKITILTTVSRVMTARLEERNRQLRDERNRLKLENQQLREEWMRIWEEEMRDGT